MRVKNKIFFVFACTLLFACSTQKQRSPEDYAAFFAEENNGLNVTRDEGKLKFQAGFITKEFLVCKSSSVEELKNSELVKKKMDEVEDLYYFNFKIWSDELSDPFYAGKADEQVYTQRMAYANTGIISDFKLLVNGDTLDCMYVNFEPTHSISKAVNFSIAFDKTAALSQIKSDLKLVYNDRLFGLGILKFNFNSSHIHQIPQLKL